MMGKAIIIFIMIELFSLLLKQSIIALTGWLSG